MALKYINSVQITHTPHYIDLYIYTFIYIISNSLYNKIFQFNKSVSPKYMIKVRIFDWRLNIPWKSKI